MIRKLSWQTPEGLVKLMALKESGWSPGITSCSGKGCSSGSGMAYDGNSCDHLYGQSLELRPSGEPAGGLLAIPSH